MEGSFLVHDLRKVISLVDLLRDIGLGSQLSLPKVVVLGNQSSGKSSLLEQIVGLDFLPRGSGVVTRRPLELRMNNVLDLKAPYAEFDEIVEGNKKKQFTNFNEVRKAIDEVTDKVCGKSKQIIDKPIILNIFSKSCPNLTIVDLPGITSIPVGEQPANIYQITKQMALRYITQPRSIILCVIPANQDLSTSQALKIMREIDPRGQRSIGCLTKIDIMNRGDDATKMLKNLEIPLRYGYVGIKNRCQQDVTNNVPVEQSLKAERKFFTTSPIYSTLSADLFGTESLTRKLTGILYQQIKSSMPEIFEEIKKKKKDAQDQLQKLGPGVANSDAELVNYAWKSISTFLRIFKNSINGIKNNDYNVDPISAGIRQELNNLYKDQYDDPATQDLTDKDIEKAMTNFPGDSTIPGFPSIDAFLALLNPLLKKLQAPAYDINNKVHQIMEKQASNIVTEVMTKKFPEFNVRFNDLVRKILEKYRKNLENYLNYLMDSELNYLYTNDVTYILGDFNRPANEKQKNKSEKNPLVYQLRKRIDAYYKLVVRNLRDLIPKQIFNFLIVKCLKELEFEAFQFTSDVNKLKEWLNQPTEVKLRRAECTKAIKVFEESEKRIRMDPDISKLIKNIDGKTSKIYARNGMKSPQAQQDEQDKKVQQQYIKQQEEANRIAAKKKDPKDPGNGGSGNTVSNQKQTPVVNNLVKKDSEPAKVPINNGSNNSGNTVINQQPQKPPQQQPVDAKVDFTNFFGTNPKQQPVTPPVNNPPPIQTVKPNNNPPILPSNNGFIDFLNKDKATTPPNSNKGPQIKSPTTNVDPKKLPNLPPPAQNPPTNPPANGGQPTTDKAKTFNKLFGI